MLILLKNRFLAFLQNTFSQNPRQEIQLLASHGHVGELRLKMRMQILW
jgi:hypothetical protein